jgi:putative transposase
VALSRQIKAGATHFITRCCVLGMHLLRPSRELNRIVRFVLAYGARQFGVRLHAVGVMSNHYHLILTDPRGALPDFMELVDSLLARALNKLHGRTGQFWETGSYSDVVLETAGEVVQKIAYALCNPVAAGCVPTPDEWPGLLTPAGRIGSGTSSKVTKPPIFFRTEGAGPADGFDQAADDHRPRGRAACEIPDELELEWSLPPFFASRDEFDRGLALALRTRMAEIKAHRKEKGWSAFLGAARRLRPPDHHHAVAAAEAVPARSPAHEPPEGLDQPRRGRRGRRDARPRRLRPGPRSGAPRLARRRPRGRLPRGHLQDARALRRAAPAGGRADRRGLRVRREGATRERRRRRRGAGREQ